MRSENAVRARSLVRRNLVATAATLALMLLFAPSAPGATASVTEDGLSYEAEPGENNNLKMTELPSGIQIIDTGAQITAGAGCSTVSEHEVLCDAETRDGVTVNLGDLNDFASLARLSAPTCCEGVSLDGGGGDDKLVGSPGQDSIHGSTGADQLSGRDSLEPESVMGCARCGPDFLLGGAGNDTLRGGRGADWIQGDSGADMLIGGSGPDAVFGGRQGDTLRGNRGRDRLFGRAGADRLGGGPRGDYLSGGLGRDRMFGRSGRDKLLSRDYLRRRDLVSGGRGFDRARVDAKDVLRSIESFY
jgi:Ca2+-binding RTX toxin-like protein